MKKGFKTFPFAIHSTPKFNARAYPVKIDGYPKSDFYQVWDPFSFQDHLIGHFANNTQAQALADTINARINETIYCGWMTNEEQDVILTALVNGSPNDIADLTEWVRDGQSPLTWRKYGTVPGEGAPQYTFLGESQLTLF